MASGEFSNGHHWRQREAWAAGQPFDLRSCTICHRTFAKSVGTQRWQAVHLRSVRFDFLGDETTQRWLSEQCPGRPLPSEADTVRYVAPGR